MKVKLILCVTALFFGALAHAQQLPPAVPLLSPSVCGKGAFSLFLGEQAIGREDFEIGQPDEPLSTSSKGNINGKSYDQSSTFRLLQS